MYYTPKPVKLSDKTKVRFFKPVTAYLINVEESYFIFNIFYKTTLEAFQELNKSNEKVTTEFFKQLAEKQAVLSMFYKH
jgi:hypothetical protein